MLKKTITPLLIGAVMLFMVVPSRVLAQTLAQAKAGQSEITLSDAQVKPKPGLKAVFSEEIAKAKARTLTSADYKLLAQAQQDDQASQQKKSGWSKREKVGLIVFIGIMLVVTTALLIHGISTEPSCFDEPSNPTCVE